MKRILLAALTVQMLGSALAGDYSDGVSAYRKRDFTEAVRLYRLAAAQGSSGAQYNLGTMYADGYGVVQDYAEAVKWFGLAAAQGDANSQYDLGLRYYNGQGVLQDYAEAVKWFRLAAAGDCWPAQYYLGLMYGKGQGVVQNYARAHMWFNLGAVGGYVDAVKGRDLIAERMTNQQIAEAQKMARDCQAKQFKGCE